MISHKQLRHALALYQEGNFRRAASAQNISQPAFSRSILSLEEKLGVTLFDRTTTSVTPTLYGKAVLRRAKVILEESVELERELQLLKGLESGVFSIAMAPYPIELCGSQAVGKLIREHPHLRCRITLSDWRDVADQVLTKTVDLGFAEISVAETYEELQTEAVGKHELILFCRKGHPLAGLSKVVKSDLDQYPLVTIRIAARMAKVFPGKAQYDKNSGHLIPAIEVQDLTTARAIVKASDAISAAAPLQIEPCLRSGELVAFPFRASWLKLNYGFIYRRDRMLPPAAEVFMQLVHRIEEELIYQNVTLMRELFPTDTSTSE